MSYYLMPGNMSFILPYSYHTFSGKCHKDNIVMDIPETMIKKKDYAIFSANRILPISSTLMPVSYTHLDVYKRQVKYDP